jgi:hypothetical protein
MASAPGASLMNTYEIRWSSPYGDIGWTTIEDCECIDEAIDFWTTHLLGQEDIPIESQLDEIKLITQ